MDQQSRLYCSSPRLTFLISDAYGIRIDFFYKPDERKTLNISISGYANSIIIKNYYVFLLSFSLLELNEYLEINEKN